MWDITLIHSTVYGYNLPRNIGRILGTQKPHHPGYFLRFSDPGHGNDGFNIFHGCIFYHIGLDQPRGNHIDPDSQSRHFGCNRPAGTDQAGLGRGIIGLTSVSEKTGDRCDGNNRAAFKANHFFKHGFGNVIKPA